MLSKGPSIQESTHIEDFLNFVEKEDFLGVFDVDNTLIQSVEALGSDQWFMKLMEFAYDAAPSKETETLVISIYHALHQYHTKMETVENVTAPMIKKLQEKNIPLIGLTARGKEISEATIAQLKRVGIEFLLNKTSQNSFGLTINGVENAAIYHHGVIFCSGYSKGDCLQAFFETIKWQPMNVVMVDDKLKHLKAIEATISPRGSQFHGIRYGHLDEKVENFNKNPDNVKKANYRLLEAYHKFPEHAKDAIQKIFLFEPRQKKRDPESKEEHNLGFGRWF